MWRFISNSRVYLSNEEWNTRRHWFSILFNWGYQVECKYIAQQRWRTSFEITVKQECGSLAQKKKIELTRRIQLQGSSFVSHFTPDWKSFQIHFLWDCLKTQTTEHVGNIKWLIFSLWHDSDHELQDLWQVFYMVRFSRKSTCRDAIVRSAGNHDATYDWSWNEHNCRRRVLFRM